MRTAIAAQGAPEGLSQQWSQVRRRTPSATGCALGRASLTGSFSTAWLRSALRSAKQLEFGDGRAGLDLPLQSPREGGGTCGPGRMRPKLRLSQDHFGTSTTTSTRTRIRDRFLSPNWACPGALLNAKSNVAAGNSGPFRLLGRANRVVSRGAMAFRSRADNSCGRRERARTTRT